ncbi:MAG: SpoVG family protein [Candidatus Eisenbacteria bacterium]
MSGESGGLRITEVRVSLQEEGRLRAFVSITIDGCFAVRGMKIIKGEKGFFVAMPSRKKPDGTYQDMVHPINPKARRHLEDVILSAYRVELEKNAVVR